MKIFPQIPEIGAAFSSSKRVIGKKERHLSYQKILENVSVEHQELFAFRCVIEGNLSHLQQYLSSHPPQTRLEIINKRDSNGASILHIAYLYWMYVGSFMSFPRSAG